MKFGLRILQKKKVWEWYEDEQQKSNNEQRSYNAGLPIDAFMNGDFEESVEYLFYEFKEVHKTPSLLVFLNLVTIGQVHFNSMKCVILAFSGMVGGAVANVGIQV